jgi:hypothetical protein
MKVTLWAVDLTTKGSLVLPAFVRNAGDTPEGQVNTAPSGTMRELH